MKTLKLKSFTAVLLACFLVLALIVGVMPSLCIVSAAENTDYGEGYRNRRRSVVGITTRTGFCMPTAFGICTINILGTNKRKALRFGGTI